MGNITYSRKYLVNGKILKQNDILRIAKLIHNEFQEGDYQEEYTFLFDDQSSIVGKNSLDVFECDEIRYKRCQQVSFTYKSKNLDNRIEIELYNSLLTISNSFAQIISTDENWYHSTCDKISTILNEIEKRKFSITNRIKNSCSTILALTESFLLAVSLVRFFPSVVNNDQGLMIAMFVCIALIFSLLNNYGFELIGKAYPNVEFAFGPDYLNQSKRIRSLFGILIPFMIDFLFFILSFIGQKG